MRTSDFFEKRILRAFLPLNRQFWFLVGTALVALLIDLGWPLGIRGLLDRITGASTHARLSTGDVFKLGGVLAAALVLMVVCEAIRNRITVRVVNRFAVQVRTNCFARLLHSDIATVEQYSPTDLAQRLSHDVVASAEFVGSGVVRPAIALARIVIAILILSFVDYRLGACALLLAPLMALATAFWARRTQTASTQMAEEVSQLQVFLQERAGALRVIRAFAAAPWEESRCRKRSETIASLNSRTADQQLLLEMIWSGVSRFTSLLTVTVGGILVSQKMISLGDLFAFQIYLFLILEPVLVLMRAIGSAQYASACFRRVLELEALPVEAPQNNGVQMSSSCVENVRFERIHFSYSAGAPVLTDVSFNLRRGTITALVGRSGAGKSTTVDLLCRFRTPTSGSIRFDDVDIGRIHSRDVCKLVSLVPQEVVLFDGTIEDNLVYGNQHVSQAKLDWATKLATADSFIKQLPEGLAHRVGQRGFRLSGGQRQRLGLARALLYDAPIVVLDEPTSNIDTESERLVKNALREISAYKIVLVIAHRLALVKAADNIVVLDNGKVAEEGTHAQLLRSQGAYARYIAEREEAIVL